MWVVGAFMELINLYDWKRTSSSGWEYLVVLKGLGFESYVC